MSKPINMHWFQRRHKLNAVKLSRHGGYWRAEINPLRSQCTGVGFGTSLMEAMFDAAMDLRDQEKAAWGFSCTEGTLGVDTVQPPG